MTREDKELLFKDLCARLPYGVKVRYSSYKEFITCTIQSINPVYNHIDLWSKNACFNPVSISKIKPYLFPLSSMTKEQFLELTDLCNMYDDYNDYDPHEYWGIQVCHKHIHRNKFCFSNNYDTIDWLNKNHFDYRGLIDKGLAIDCTNLNIY